MTNHLTISHTLYGLFQKHSLEYIEKNYKLHPYDNEKFLHEYNPKTEINVDEMKFKLYIKGELKMEIELAVMKNEIGAISNINYY